MTASGTHKSNSWAFIDSAMRDFTGLTKLAVYYFWVQCEQNPGIDSVFSPFLDASLKGSSISIASQAEDDNDTMYTGNLPKKHKVSNTLSVLAEQGASMVKSMEESKQDRQAAFEETKQKNKFMAKLEVAKALGNREMLQSLLKEANNME